jgi:hypothetical protein
MRALIASSKLELIFKPPLLVIWSQLITRRFYAALIYN